VVTSNALVQEEYALFKCLISYHDKAQLAVARNVIDSVTALLEEN
jgi:hypothetical protein